jgi:hypothetical protein
MNVIFSSDGLLVLDSRPFLFINSNNIELITETTITNEINNNRCRLLGISKSVP